MKRSLLASALAAVLLLGLSAGFVFNEGTHARSRRSLRARKVSTELISRARNGHGSDLVQ